jgi:hypothetical protein
MPASDMILSTGVFAVPDETGWEGFGNGTMGIRWAGVFGRRMRMEE